MLFFHHGETRLMICKSHLFGPMKHIQWMQLPYKFNVGS
jgi:hypothetical protein